MSKRWSTFLSRVYGGFGSERAYSALSTERRRLWAVQAVRLLSGRQLLVRFDTNFLCNLRCTTCFFSNPETAGRLKNAMSVDDFARVAANLFPRTRMLYLSCSAEPLMTPHFERYLDLVGPHGVPLTGFVTNAILMNTAVMEAAVRNGVDEITISIDGATKRTYEAIRKGARWEQLLAALDLMNEVKARRGARQPVLRFNFTGCRTNLADLPALVDLAAGYGVESVHVRPAADWGGVIDMSRESLALEPERYHTTLNEARARARAVGLELFAPRSASVGTTEVEPEAEQGASPAGSEEAAVGAAGATGEVPDARAIDGSGTPPGGDAAATDVPPAQGGSLPGPAVESDPVPILDDLPAVDAQWKPYSCALPWYFAYVGPDGSYWPCFHLREKREPDGNLVEQSWNEIWTGERAVHRRRRLARCPGESCLNVCQGEPGC